MNPLAQSFSILTLIVAGASGCGGIAPASQSGDEKAMGVLVDEVKSLRELVPDQAHIMADVGYHYTNLWFAGRAENWPLADFYLAETRSHLRWAVRSKPIRKDRENRDINLPNILEAFENGPLTRLKQMLDRKERATFEAAYKDCLTACYSCHKASDKPYLRPQVPGRADSSIINVDPRADWPL